MNIYQATLKCRANNKTIEIQIYACKSEKVAILSDFVDTYSERGNCQYVCTKIEFIKTIG